VFALAMEEGWFIVGAFGVRRFRAALMYDLENSAHCIEDYYSSLGNPYAHLHPNLRK